MSDDSRTKPLSNNLVPRRAILVFGLVFMGGLLVLPFALYYGMARTQNQSHGMNLAVASGLPFEVRDLRPTSRENPEAGLLAVHYAIPANDRTAVGAALAPVAAIPRDTADALAAVSPREKFWAPDATRPGPWFAGAGVKNGLAWRALFDGTTGDLWLVATPAR